MYRKLFVTVVLIVCLVIVSNYFMRQAYLQKMAQIETLKPLVSAHIANYEYAKMVVKNEIARMGSLRDAVDPSIGCRDLWEIIASDNKPAPGVNISYAAFTDKDPLPGQVSIRGVSQLTDGTYCPMPGDRITVELGPPVAGAESQQLYRKYKDSQVTVYEVTD